MLFAIGSGFAQDFANSCSIYGRSYQLESDTVVWSMTIGSGQSCTRGVRTNQATLDSIKLIAPPQSGQVKLEGPGFVYKANSDFRGDDSFAILVSGKRNRISGTSTIRFAVSVR
jgi:hypothetical protein